MQGTRLEALRPIRQGVKERSRAIDEGVGAGLALPPQQRVASQSAAPSFGEIRWLGIDSSPPFVRSPQGNGGTERFIPLKENPLWPETYSCTEDPQRALQRFKDKYNEKWLFERHRYRSPGQSPRDEDETRTAV